MSLYKYKSIDQHGKVLKGQMHASNILELEQRIVKQQQDLISYNEVRERELKFLTKRKLERSDLINLVFQLEQLTKSGVPLLDGLKDLRDSANGGYYRDVLASVIESIEGGKKFSEALREFENDFDSIFISLIAVGEESGELPKILNDMGNTLKWIDELVSATVRILIYPAIVGVVVLSVTVFLMVYLVPKIIPFIAEMGGEIPFHTVVLIAVSNFVTNYWYLIFGLPIAGLITVKYLAKKRPNVRRFVDRLKLKVPIVGNIIFKIKIARLMNYMALLYSSGITVLRSLDICKNLMDNKILEEAVVDVRQRISDGASLSESFESAHIFPRLVVRMVKVGENTGNLDEALYNVSYFYNREVQEAIDKIEPAITPILTVVMGVLLGWIMMSVLGPIWDTIGSIGT
ncbi:Type II secretion system protein F [Thalassocella blandensis]|nr:Type II secretion system protein F [Thalassocella blandensis]